jgi:DNA-directed RNA polymerase sigma subunit (sigma70/sigma32)
MERPAPNRSGTLVTEVDLIAPPTPTASAEFAAACSDTGAGDDLDAFGIRAGRLPQLSAEAQAELVAVYQHGRRVARALDAQLVPAELTGAAQRVVARANTAAEQMVGSVFRLVRQLVWERASRRFGDRGAVEILPDLLADAYVSTLAAAGEFDPSRGTKFSSWVVQVLDREIPKHLNRAWRMNTVPRSWDILSKIAPHVLEELGRELGREPSNEEFAERLEARCRAWARERLTAEERSLPEEAQEQAISARLTRQGIGRVLREEIPALRQALQSEACLDAPVGDDSATLLDTVAHPDGSAEDEAADAADILAAGLGACSAEEQEMVLACFGLGTGDESNARQVGVRYGRSEAEVRGLVRLVKARLAAPHAQFAFYAGLTASQLSVVDDDHSAAAVLRRQRRSRGAGHDDEAALLAALDLVA